MLRASQPSGRSSSSGPPMTKLFRAFVTDEVRAEGVVPLVVGVRFPRLSTTALRLPVSDKILHSFTEDYLFTVFTFGLTY